MRNIVAKIVVLGSHAESLIIFRFDMLRALATHNEVIACVPEPTAAVIAKLNSIGITCHNVKLARTGLNPFADLNTFFRLVWLMRKLKPDQIFTYTSKPVIFGSLAARLAGVPEIYSMITGLGSYFIHQDFKSRMVRKIMSNMYKFALRFNTKVFWQNPDDIADFARNKIFLDAARTVITNGSGVDLTHFQPMALPSEKISFLLTARLILAKGVIEYLAAAREIKQMYPQVEFLLVGWFDQKAEMINADFIAEYSSQGVIRFLGKLDDVRPALAQTSIFVLPSYREGTPKTVLEAMACGRAIIATDVPGCRETVREGENGFLVPARDIASLRKAMEKFIINPGLIAQMGQRSRELAVAKYDVNQVNKVILNAMGHSYV